VGYFYNEDIKKKILKKLQIFKRRKPLMQGKTGLFCCLFLVFCGVSFLFPAERYALVIGNGNYKDKNIPTLANPVNDAADVASSLRALGYTVTLKTNLGLRDLRNAIVDFSGNLGQNSDSEGFFWFAGHGISVKGIHYLLPTDADTTDDFSIPRTSFSVDDLMEQIENARNKTNLIVIDACRNNLAPGGRGVGSRGLTVLSQDDYRIKGNKIVYSTMAGKSASDGATGSRNSPFARAFLDNMQEPEIFDDVFLDIANETLQLTKGEQEPYSMGTFAVKSYSLNPQGAAQTVAGAAPSTSVQTTVVNPNTPAPQYYSSDFILDGRQVKSLSVQPIFYGSTFSSYGGFGLGVTYTFHEQYRSYGDRFYLPNSFYVSFDLFSDARTVQPNGDSVFLSDGQNIYSGGILGLGAQWKIRLGEQQRFIANFGLSLEFFIGTSEFYYDSNKESEYTMGFEPGLGLHGGLSFRFTRLVSLDFGLAWKFDFLAGSPQLGSSYSNNSYLGGTTFATGIHPYTFGGSLGVSFWWPR